MKIGLSLFSLIIRNCNVLETSAFQFEDRPANGQEGRWGEGEVKKWWGGRVRWADRLMDKWSGWR